MHPESELADGWLGHEASDEEIIDHMLKISKTLPEITEKHFLKQLLLLLCQMVKFGALMEKWRE